ncbi:hypothetical protein CRENBAI_011127 [Crenichthys baileyi]|uniref:Uncharacterized protein n=1 Tax=Crenichthys baileyi TaxID=28760 RepID=A0AAV9R2N1_9TELE
MEEILPPKDKQPQPGPWGGNNRANSQAKAVEWLEKLVWLLPCTKQYGCAGQRPYPQTTSLLRRAVVERIAVCETPTCPSPFAQQWLRVIGQIVDRRPDEKSGNK